MAIVINAERPDTPVAMELIGELDGVLNPNYAPESRFGYSVEKLIQQGVAFFVVYVDGTPAGCGGVQIFGDEYAELKRMFVRPQFRGLGLGRQLVNRLADYALENGIKVLRLETGNAQVEALNLYVGMGFRHILPFGVYVGSATSICMEKRIG
jgi:putative acetyltransferase